jgi:hypothetical protein
MYIVPKKIKIFVVLIIHARQVENHCETQIIPLHCILCDLVTSQVGFQLHNLPKSSFQPNSADQNFVRKSSLCSGTILAKVLDD